ncbi:hypothetical protein DU505_09350 [Billgrantia montanilacus]|uniref:Uncharacterized protein n=1 Tax=Billgrantia montanilacus TaxID=2282305 RepID=A0A368TY54_9GAMM|nr:hypothetical protein DU505_09350 [Halomonas montanilacus]
MGTILPIRGVVIGLDCRVRRIAALSIARLRHLAGGSRVMLQLRSDIRFYQASKEVSTALVEPVTK